MLIFAKGKTISFLIDFFECLQLYCSLDFYEHYRTQELGESLSAIYPRDRV